MEENFIRAYDGVLDDFFIDELIQYIDTKQQYFRKRTNKRVTDCQIPLEPFFKDLSHQIDSKVIAMLERYFKDFPILNSEDVDWISGSTFLQKTNPTEGYHTFHYENSGWDEQTRSLSWMIYLNTVEEGGETEFLYQQLRVKPKKNLGLIWPGSFTHIHRGLPPINETKYILTGWFVPSTGMRKYNFIES